MPLWPPEQEQEQEPEQAEALLPPPAQALPARSAWRLRPPKRLQRLRQWRQRTQGQMQARSLRPRFRSRRLRSPAPPGQCPLRSWRHDPCGHGDDAFGACAHRWHRPQRLPYRACRPRRPRRPPGRLRPPLRRLRRRLRCRMRPAGRAPVRVQMLQPQAPHLRLKARSRRTTQPLLPLRPQRQILRPRAAPGPWPSHGPGPCPCL